MVPPTKASYAARGRGRGGSTTRGGSISSRGGGRGGGDRLNRGRSDGPTKDGAKDRRPHNSSVARTSGGAKIEASLGRAKLLKELRECVRGLLRPTITPLLQQSLERRRAVVEAALVQHANLEHEENMRTKYKYVKFLDSKKIRRHLKRAEGVLARIQVQMAADADAKSHTEEDQALLEEIQNRVAWWTALKAYNEQYPRNMKYNSLFNKERVALDNEHRAQLGLGADDDNEGADAPAADGTPVPRLTAIPDDPVLESILTETPATQQQVKLAHWFRAQVARHGLPPKPDTWVVMRHDVFGGTPSKPSLSLPPAIKAAIKQLDAMNRASTSGVVAPSASTLTSTSAGAAVAPAAADDGVSAADESASDMDETGSDAEAKPAAVEGDDFFM
ncbi:hypothetical protein CXG81DRAFT_18139 [Caulochytrium protostelioides]|uniref:rRNA-processing protein EFG1 n=1 Tax=Caulochytrium protostelioides TaxID=1555241 RepID=A0A4P9XAK7_9FUNG|nr:hypothetical protein CXG81DRAFT_18139 [Caulochytrium protostelioides]|eukprot:RKP02170.1 hypothetical protein CXG81DRAFT_18139 [Caulochytrium protostelioides]